MGRALKDLILTDDERREFADESDIATAERYGCKIEKVEHHNQPDRYYWRHGHRHSVDRYSSFTSAGDAARHFLANAM